MIYWKQKPMQRSSAVNFLGPLAVAYTLLIGWGSLIHVPEFVQEAPKNSDKIIHTTAYFIFCSLWIIFLYYKGLKKRPLNTVLWISALWSLFFGMVIEILQYDLTTYRTGDYYDMIANSTGVLLSVICAIALRRKLKNIKLEY